MSNSVTPLPCDLLSRYDDWKTTDFKENEASYVRLAKEGQNPKAMVISCCDSRVLPTDIFGAMAGDFFVHRNIANLVPPYTSDDGHHGTAAAIEYGVTALKVAHLIVMGHTLCGGVRGCYDMCSNKNQLNAERSFVERWIDILRPSYEKVIKGGGNAEEQISRLEEQGILMSIENLLSFPFIAERVEKKQLELHALIFDITDGTLRSYDHEKAKFCVI